MPHKKVHYSIHTSTGPGAIAISRILPNLDFGHFCPLLTIKACHNMSLRRLSVYVLLHFKPTETNLFKCFLCNNHFYDRLSIVAVESHTL